MYKRWGTHSEVAVKYYPYAAESNRLPFLPDYDSAVAHYNKVVPIRGTNTRPIHLRRYKERELTMLPDDHGVVTYWHEGNPVVKWLPDGQIHLNLPKWNLMQEAISYLLGVPIKRAQNAMWLLPDNMDKYVKLNEGTTVCRRTSRGLLTVSSLDVRYRYFIKRAQAKKVRDIYKPFVDRVVRNMRLRDDGYSLKEYGDVFGYVGNLDSTVWNSVKHPPFIGARVTYRADNSMQQSYDFLEQVKAALHCNDVEALYKLELQAIWHAHRDIYSRITMRPTENDFYKLMQEVVFLAHRDEVFEQRKVEATDSTFDRNERYFMEELGQITK